MKLGLQLGYDDPRGSVELAQEADRLGFHSAWTSEAWGADAVTVATWIAATNSMECRTPNDIYLLLKSSDFVTHDLQHALDDTEDGDSKAESSEIAYHLVLRKWIVLNPSVEFRCFVRDRKLIAICQRDLNHFDFLFKMEDKLRQTIQDFFDLKLRDTFPDANFTFDVYIPPPHDKVWLVDFNPWALRTDPLLFSWMELLTMEVPSLLNVQDASKENPEEDNDDDEDDELTEGFWQEFFLHRPDSAGLKRVLSEVSPDEMLHIQAHSQQLFRRAIHTVKQAQSPSDEIALEVRAYWPL